MQAHAYRIASISIYAFYEGQECCLCDDFFKFQFASRTKKKKKFGSILYSDSAGGHQLKLTLFAKIRVVES